ncbi:hypothetical protein PpBr36_08019 [Pyricularia pennisetigena]|uniref:hypothetical protein n=1 Tax=Pyricularia pennisetigena TaxID=1578925 RepID=UPI001153A49F|nr:hypothetical protein PpBr36_08019 [Pyricularia pennisetigena]TLS24930.1 hypothetical protein PpBr36_08019 [Pyricularia pennisetigena]
MVNSSRVSSRLSGALRQQQKISTTCITTRQLGTSPSSLSSSSSRQHQKQNIDFKALLSRPTWSVRSLLPPNTTSPEPSSSPPSSSTTTISTSQLTHLHALSALPNPTIPSTLESLTRTLQSQLHFVRAIQAVDTTGVAPLSAIRDETAAGRSEQTVTLDHLADVLRSERPIGRARRPRRLRATAATAEVAEAGGVSRHGEPGWDVLGAAKRRAGQYFVVKSSSTKQEP